MREPDKREKRKVSFFGCLLDCDERYDSVEEKLDSLGFSGVAYDPYRALLELLRKEVDESLFEEKGHIRVPEWLMPVPPGTERGNLRTERFVSFIDGEGCREFASLAGEFIRNHIHPRTPCLIGIDHSLTGGAFRFLSEIHSPENISLIVLDSHTDAIPVSALMGAIDYDRETNPNSVHDFDDPLLVNRSESYNACSFLFHLLEEKAVEPGNLFLLGVGDFPPKRAFRMKDPRIKRYVDTYNDLKGRGVKIITKKDLLTNPSKVGSVLGEIKTPWIYISIDLDVGAKNALDEVRFLDRQGVNEHQLYGISGQLREVLSRGIALAGMDLMEFNPRRIPPGEPPERISAYRIAANLIKMLCFDVRI